jgi:prefoldin subunit 5
MKKKILFILLGAMLCALPFIFNAKTKTSAHASSVKEEVEVETQEWTKEDTKEILAYVATGASGVATALAFAVPIYLKVKKAKDAVIEAKNGICEEKKNSKEFADRLDKSENYLKKQDHEFQQALQRNAEIIDKMSAELAVVKEICVLGFINNKELVSKGIATQISKVGHNEEHKE